MYMVFVFRRLAKEEMNRQDLRQRLAAVDADVTEAYKRVSLKLFLIFSVKTLLVLIQKFLFNKGSYPSN